MRPQQASAAAGSLLTPVLTWVWGKQTKKQHSMMQIEEEMISMYKKNGICTQLPRHLLIVSPKYQAWIFLKFKYGNEMQAVACREQRATVLRPPRGSAICPITFKYLGVGVEEARGIGFACIFLKCLQCMCLEELLKQIYYRKTDISTNVLIVLGTVVNKFIPV